MSRHKLVKTLNLDDELDDFDGCANDDHVDAGDEQGECYKLGLDQVISNSVDPNRTQRP